MINTIQSAVCFTKNIVASAPGLKCRDLVDKYFPLALDQVVFTAKLKSHIPSPPFEASMKFVINSCHRTSE